MRSFLLLLICIFVSTAVLMKTLKSKTNKPNNSNNAIDDIQTAEERRRNLTDWWRSFKTKPKLFNSLKHANSNQEARSESSARSASGQSRRSRPGAGRRRRKVTNAKQRLHQIFSQVDRDGNNLLTSQEFMRALSIIGITSDLDMDRVFKSLDHFNQKGVISAGDFWRTFQKEALALEKQRKSPDPTETLRKAILTHYQTAVQKLQKKLVNQWHERHVLKLTELKKILQSCVISPQIPVELDTVWDKLLLGGSGSEEQTMSWDRFINNHAKASRDPANSDPEVMNDVLAEAIRKSFITVTSGRPRNPSGSRTSRNSFRRTTPRSRNRLDDRGASQE